MAEIEEAPKLFEDNAELNEAAGKLWAEFEVVPKLLAKFDVLCADGTPGLTKDLFRGLFVDIAKENYGDPISSSIVNFLEVLYDCKLSHTCEHHIYLVTITAIDKFGTLLDDAWDIFTSNGMELATKQHVVAFSALWYAVFGSYPVVVTWETAVHFLYEVVSEQENEIKLSDLKTMAKRFASELLCALKGISDAVFSFKNVFNGEFAVLLDE